MTKIMFTADVVKIADFKFRHVRNNKIYLKMGLNLIFYYKKLLGTLKLTHLLYKNKTFVSKPTGIQGAKKIGKINFFIVFSKKCL